MEGREIPSVKHTTNLPQDNLEVQDLVNISPSITDNNCVNHEEQKRNHTHNSVYLSLQNNLIKIIKIIKPKSILELGIGGAQTAVEVAKICEKKKLTLVNSDCEMTNKAKELISSKRLENIDIYNEDMERFVKEKDNLEKFDFIYLLYNFHHISHSPSSKRKKTDFIANCFENMNTGAYLCIADVFLPKLCSENKLESDSFLKDLYEKRAKKIESSSFWNFLKNVTLKDIHEATDYATHCKMLEEQVGLNVKIQQGEYLIKKNWLVKQAEQIGFTVLIKNDVNSINDAIVLLLKE